MKYGIRALLIALCIHINVLHASIADAINHTGYCLFYSGAIRALVIHDSLAKTPRNQPDSLIKNRFFKQKITARNRAAGFALLGALLASATTDPSQYINNH